MIEVENVPTMVVKSQFSPLGGKGPAWKWSYQINNIEKVI